MGFRDAKKGVLLALSTGAYQHEARGGDIYVKNKLAVGEITPGQVADIIKKCRGSDHATSPHHQIQAIDVHVLKKDGWYIKFYLLDSDTWFISVHQ
ncbi:conserved hypothetical protein [Magnetospirillum sp. LM-5]|uniref:hypothetical protein n=1 Tax=Magnetospirillum sp. LM-5 TaxID=2681466 RepID=UPI00137C8FB3|nr:hypothetical protein [Magnetospirillum sp. LM-5]CAA7617207.1 conserved hypothetical protein [Magnetospirillum sp. LM-5]